jgi:cytochrome P450
MGSGRCRATQTAWRALRNPRVYSSAQGTSLEPLKAQVPTLLNSDPPVHTRLRQLLGQLFLPAAIAPLEDAVRAMARELLSPHAGGGRLDVITDFAARLPMAIICQLLGFPRNDEDMLRSWTDAVVHRDEGRVRDARGRHAGDVAAVCVFRGRPAAAHRSGCAR